MPNGCPRSFAVKNVFLAGVCFVDISFSNHDAVREKGKNFNSYQFASIVSFHSKNSFLQPLSKISFANFLRTFEFLRWMTHASRQRNSLGCRMFAVLVH